MTIGKTAIFNTPVGLNKSNARIYDYLNNLHLCYTGINI